LRKSPQKRKCGYGRTSETAKSTIKSAMVARNSKPYKKTLKVLATKLKEVRKFRNSIVTSRAKKT
jgi:hypothetical protein